MVQFKRTGRLVLAATLALSVLLTACSNSGKEGQGGSDAASIAPMGREDEASLKVMFWDQQSLMSQYGNLFLSKFPNVDIQVANTNPLYAYEGNDNPMKLVDYVEEMQPDVLLLEPDQYEELFEAGKLTELDTMVSKDGYDLEGMHPAVIELIKEKSGGGLYGLAPTFNSVALFYNIDLFQRYGIDQPTDRMSLSEVFQLASRFPSGGSEEERIYGLSVDTPEVFNVIWQLGTALGLSITDGSVETVTVDTPAWQEVFETVIGAIRAGTMYLPSGYGDDVSTYADYLKSDLFVSGRAAMTLSDPWLIQKLTQAEEELKDVDPVNWAIVTVPVDPANPDVSGSFSVGTIFAIRADSPNKSAAWEFLKYVNGDEYAKIISRTASSDLLTRTAYVKDFKGRSLESFYALKPRATAASALYKAPASFLGPFGSIVEEEMQALREDKKTLEEALGALQTRGQAALDEAYATEKLDEAEQGGAAEADSRVQGG